MRIKIILFIAAFSSFLASCSSKYSVKTFTQVSDVSQFDGSYDNRPSRTSDYPKDLSKVLDIYADSIKSVNLKFEKKQMTIAYQTDSGVQEKVYKGKFKKNYFEVYLTKKIIPIPLFFLWHKERVRLGLSGNKNLQVQYYQYQFGWILLLTAGSADDSEYEYPQIKD